MSWSRILSMKNVFVTLNSFFSQFATTVIIAIFLCFSKVFKILSTFAVAKLDVKNLTIYNT